MTIEMEALKRRAEEGRTLYRQGVISRDEAKKMVIPYIEAFNKKSAEIAKKYGMRPKKISFAIFMR